MLTHANSLWSISCGQRSGSEVSHSTEPQKPKGLSGAPVSEPNIKIKHINNAVGVKWSHVSLMRLMAGCLSKLTLICTETFINCMNNAWLTLWNTLNCFCFCRKEPTQTTVICSLQTPVQWHAENVSEPVWSRDPAWCLFGRAYN